MADLQNHWPSEEGEVSLRHNLSERDAFHFFQVTTRNLLQVFQESIAHRMLEPTIFLRDVKVGFPELFGIHIFKLLTYHALT